MSLAFFSAVPARDHSCHHTCARARHDNRDDDDDHAKFQDRDHNGPDQLSVLSLPNPFPKLTARARSQVRSRRDTVTDAAAAAQHTAVTVVIGGRTAAWWRARCGSGG